MKHAKTQKSTNYSCDLCGFITNRTPDYIRHTLTAKHIMKQREPQKSTNYSCDLCGFITNRTSDYIRHTLTAKHIMKQRETQNCVSTSDHLTPSYICICRNSFNSRTTLWRHKQKCVYNEHTPDNITIVFDQDEILEETQSANTVEILEEPTSNEDQDTFIPNNIHNNEIYNMMQQVLEQQHITQQQQHITQQQQQTILEQQSHLLELANNPQPTTIINNNNKNITVNVFLNTHCKDAITFEEFVSNIITTDEDMNYLILHGCLDGITHLYNKYINTITITKQPIHCTDLKRHINYIKKDAGWIKETDQSSLFKVARLITRKYDIIFEKIINDIDIDTTLSRSEKTDKKTNIANILYCTNIPGGHPRIIEHFLKNIEEYSFIDKAVIQRTIK